MTTDWARLVRAVVHGEYFLKSFEREQQGSGLFRALSSEGTAVDVYIVPADSPEADAFGEHWSAASSLSHPGLVKTFAFGEDRIDGSEYLCAVAERPDDSLSDLLAARSLTTDEVREVLECSLAALQQLHQRKYLHGSFGVGSIVACGGSTKLTTDTIRPFSPSKPEDRVAFLQEIRSVGDCIVRMLSGPGKPLAPARVPPEFTMILRTASMGDEKWSPTAVDLVHALRGVDIKAQEETLSTPSDTSPQVVEVAAPAKVSPQVARKPAPDHRVVMAGAALLALILLTIYFAWPKATVDTAASPPSRPEFGGEAPVERVPVNAPQLVPRPTTRAARPETQERARRTGEWAVVAAIYKNREAAEKRAEQLATRWKGNKPEVVPPVDGARRYVVVLGSGLSKEDATRLRSRAVSTGMPRDSYVTKLSW